MSITRYPPNTVFLGGTEEKIGDLAASESITPGHLVERFVDSTVIKFRKHATAGGDTARLVAVNQSMINKGVDDVYAAGDLMQVSAGKGGSTYWMLIASGQNIAAGDALESAGNGTLRIYGSGAKLFSALEGKATVTVLTRIKVEVI